MRITVARAALRAAVAAAGLICFVQVDVRAQQRDTLQTRLTLPPLPTYQAPALPAPPPVRTVSIFPATTVSSPSALGAEGGTLYLGVGYQERTRYLQNRDDGAVVGGIGIGNAREYAGLELSVTSYSTVRSGWFNRVGFGAQVHRLLTEETAIAIGAENVVMINGDESDSGRSFYGAVTRLFPLRSDPTEPFGLFTATLGLGSGRFRTENDVLADRSTVGVFGAVSLSVIRPISLIADWTGQDLALGMSIAPFARFPLVITPALVDVTRTAGDGARFVIAAGVGHRLSKGPIQF